MKAVSVLSRWTLAEALELCTRIEAIAPKFGCHVGLTGGLLYKYGPRKDCDLILYRIRQCEDIDIDGLFLALQQALGILRTFELGFCQKAIIGGKRLDFLLPEEIGGSYQQEEEPSK